MPIFGPYEIGTKIPDTALVGVDTEKRCLYAAVGDFAANTVILPANADRQEINRFGVVQDYEYCGPSTLSRVTAWTDVPRD